MLAMPSTVQEWRLLPICAALERITSNSSLYGWIHTDFIAPPVPGPGFFINATAWCPVELGATPRPSRGDPSSFGGGGGNRTRQTPL